MSDKNDRSTAKDTDDKRKSDSNSDQERIRRKQAKMVEIRENDHTTE